MFMYFSPTVAIHDKKASLHAVIKSSHVHVKCVNNTVKKVDQSLKSYGAHGS